MAKQEAFLSREETKRIIVAKLAPLGVQRIALFGSFARREDSDSSDIDILVKLSKTGGTTPIGLEWFILDKELAEALGRPVDLVSEDALNRDIKLIISRDLEIIYEKAG